MSDLNVVRVDELTKVFADTAEILREWRLRPNGPTPGASTTQEAGKACVSLAGDPDKGRTLWKLVVQDCGGYMPASAAKALIRAAATANLVPDIEAPEVE